VIDGARQILVKAFTFIDVGKVAVLQGVLCNKKKAFSSSFVQVSKLLLQKVTIAGDSHTQKHTHTHIRVNEL
jgi:hypothetical protein